MQYSLLQIFATTHCLRIPSSTDIQDFFFYTKSSVVVRVTLHFFFLTVYLRDLFYITA